MEKTTNIHICIYRLAIEKVYPIINKITQI